MSDSPQDKEEVWTFQKLHLWTRNFLTDKGFESAELETQLLMAHAFGCKKVEIFTRYAEKASDEGRARLRALIKQRGEGKPIAHLVGYKEFFSLQFEVNPSVLIPRDESQWIVIECLKLAKEMDSPRILDLGTGSGNLPISIATQNNKAKLVTVDISEDALEVARRNSEKHQVSDRIEFVQSDLFESLGEVEPFHFVISNPPYIKSGDIATLERDVRDYDPHLALDGGEDGLAVIARIVTEAKDYLQQEGYLIFEIGSDQEEEARGLVESVGDYTLHPTIKDHQGHPRVIVAQR